MNDQQGNPMGENPVSLMLEYSPVLDSIHDRLAGTITVYKEEVLRNPLTNQPITNSAGKPLTYLKQQAIPKDGVTALLNKDGVDFCMGALTGVVNRATAFANVGLSDIVFTCNDVCGLLNDNVTINSQHYGIVNLAAWKSETRVIREFLWNYLSSVKGGGMRDWSGGILGVNYNSPMGGVPIQPRREGGLLQRIFTPRKQLTDNNSQYGSD